MADITGVRNFHGLRFRRADEMERVAANIDVAYRLRNLGHVTFDALVAGAARFMVGVLLDRGGVRSVG